MFLIIILIFILIIGGVFYIKGSAENKLIGSIQRKVEEYEKNYPGVKGYLKDVGAGNLKQFVRTEKIKSVKDFKKKTLLRQRTFLKADQVLALKKFGKKKIKARSLNKGFRELHEDDFEN